jgi:ABC-type transport system involved in multi-copper enzyme maturation permease subunit
MFGPHFYYDLIRLARKPRNYYLRGAYLGALLIGWWYVYEGSQPLGDTINDFARLARNFTFALLGFQYAMILLLTPIYLAGTIVEERESRTLELLYQTQLTDRDILLGKFAARVVHLMFFTLMSLPMLAIISLWGGISVEFLLLHFAFSLLLILLVGSMCLWVSVTASRYTEAMMIAYTLEFAICYGSMPIMMVASQAGGVNWLASSAVELSFGLLLLALPMLAATWFFYWIALRALRRLRNMSWMKRAPTPPQRLPRAKAKPKLEHVRPRRRRHESASRPVPDNALLWKETEHTRYTADFPVNLVWAALGVVASMAGTFAFLRLLNWAEDLRNTMLVFSVMAYVGMVGAVYLVTAFQATSSVANERERNTLEFLLLLPIDRWEILFYKWVAPWVRNRQLVVAAFAIPLIGMLATMFPPRPALLMLILPWPSLLMINALGMFLSVACRRTVTANILMVAILLLFFLGHLLLWNEFALLMQGVGDLFFAEEMAGNPNLDAADRLHAYWLVFGQQALFLLLALVFAALAFRRFEAETTVGRPA